MNTYFNIRYEFDHGLVGERIAQTLKDGGASYICVADANVVTNAFRHHDYADIINGGMFAISDSSWVPTFIRWIHGKDYEHYCGAMIFEDIVRSRKYRMLFLGAHQEMLNALQANVAKTMNPDVADMKFVELPFCHVDDFDYEGIARMIEEDGADIIWVALGAPKQEQFMHRLQPHLKRGVMIAVGAVFKFYSGLDEKRAPEWVRKRKLEFIYRVMQEPKKQLRRCWKILITIPQMLWEERKRAISYQRETISV